MVEVLVPGLLRCAFERFKVLDALRRLDVLG
jgi:hypothetical protein